VSQLSLAAGRLPLPVVRRRSFVSQEGLHILVRIRFGPLLSTQQGATLFLVSASMSVLANQVQEPALVIVIQIGQVIAELREIVAHADLEVLPEVAVDL
jgi:hypothetical protein